LTTKSAKIAKEDIPHSRELFHKQSGMIPFDAKSMAAMALGYFKVSAYGLATHGYKR
jgi:hypothetical protein